MFEFTYDWCVGPAIDSVGAALSKRNVESWMRSLAVGRALSLVLTRARYVLPLLNPIPATLSVQLPPVAR